MLQIEGESEREGGRANAREGMFEHVLIERGGWAMVACRERYARQLI